MNRPDGEARPLLNGVRQWVKVAGAAHGTVPLVVLHGGPGGNHFVFERVAGPGLEAARTVVYHEQRGSGRSDPPEPADAYSLPLLTADLRSLLDWLGAEQADLLGYSFGGGLALEFARACPERVRRLVLQAPALHLRDPEVTASQLAGFGEVAQGDVGARVQAILREALSPEEQLERVWGVVDTPTVDRFLFQRADVAARNRALWAESGLTNSGAMHRVLAAQPPTGTAQHLTEITAPTLILAGRHDRNVPLAQLKRLAAALPAGQLHVFGSSAHFPDVEEPDRYVQAVLAFLT